MPGKVEQANTAALEPHPELADGLLHVAQTHVGLELHVEPQPREGAGHVLGVVGRILQRLVLVGRVADDQGIAPDVGLGRGREQNQRSERKNESGDGAHGKLLQRGD